MNKDKNKPSTIAEAVNRLLSDLPIETKQQIKNSREEDLINFHFSLGTAIRNEFNLWEKDSKLLQDCIKVSGLPMLHVDDATEIILKALWERLKKFPPPAIVK